MILIDFIIIFVLIMMNKWMMRGEEKNMFYYGKIMLK